ncbi:hypothetical protein A0H81_01673 [Grifola frondosa]|uniref:Uncharacterized protein n=1 Tax=Grifola frondosa TaxID=5627 RepID=A0A1C7MNP1_GRIFR|nr:hypothetical protein A0H81_01673 [Grifola frondosa]
MEEFCRLTQIPLECSHPQDLPGSSSRPPWVRPVRKKTPSVARSPANSAESPSHHGSPEDYQPTDAFLDLSGGSPQTPAAPFSPTIPGAYGLSGPSGPSFMDSPGAMNMMSQDSAMSMSPADILALFNDGTVDMSSLLMSPDLPGATEQPGNGFYGMSTSPNGNGNRVSP